MFGKKSKKKLSQLDIELETTAFLETLSDQELLDRAEAKSLAAYKEKYGADAEPKYLVCEGEEMDVYHARKERQRKEKEERELKAIGFGYSVKRIVFSPIASFVNLVGFLCYLIAKISFLGLIVGVYYLYQSFSAMAKGVPFAEIDTFAKAIPYIIFPFIAYAVSEGLDALYKWCRKKRDGL